MAKFQGMERDQTQMERLLGRLELLHLPIKSIRIDFYDTEEGSLTFEGPTCTDGTPLQFHWKSDRNGKTYTLGPNDGSERREDGQRL